MAIADVIATAADDAWSAALWRAHVDRALLALRSFKVGWPAPRLPTRETELHVQHMGGAVARVPVEDTAFAHRDAGFFVNLIGVATGAEGFGPMRDAVRGLYERILASKRRPEK